MTMQSVTGLKGVGAEVEKKLARLGITTISELLEFYPRKYTDYSKILPISRIKTGPVTIKGTLHDITTSQKRRGLTLIEAAFNDSSGSVGVVWFNQPWLKQQLKPNQEYYVSGELVFQYGRYSITNPAVEPVSDDPTQTARIIPIYPETKGLSSKQISGFVKQALPYAKQSIDELPAWLVTDMHFPTKQETITTLHFPRSGEELEKAQKREAFTEIFALSLAGQVNKQFDQSFAAPQIPFAEEHIVSFVKKLPFTLTDAQRKVLWTVLKDTQHPSPMNRLVEGDVGSGKTIVATVAAYNTVLAGFQVAFVAPTDILATQHLEGLREQFGSELCIELLTGSKTGAVKKELKAAIVAGEVDIVVGTHALFQSDVQFHKLGLVIIDEQHRFGVDQRQSLLKQTKNTMPHVLTMTATPIPRSLALTLYGELSLSIMNELPPGRKPVQTKIVSPNSRKSMYLHVEQEIAKGRQAFIVYPLITESESMEAKSIEKDIDHIKYAFKKARVAVLHGKMKPAEKEEIMRDYVNHKIDILVGTTVIEVGVNVPNASIIIIEGAERFGLAQLHQLRGRVARASHQSYCYVVPSGSLKPPQRLREFEKSTDGFALAEYDLKARGPGAIYGKRQSGMLELDLTTLDDKKLIQTSQVMAEKFIQRGENLLHYPRLERLVNTYVKITKLN